MMVRTQGNRSRSDRQGPWAEFDVGLTGLMHERRRVVSRVLHLIILLACLPLGTWFTLLHKDGPPNVTSRRLLCGLAR